MRYTRTIASHHVTVGDMILLEIAIVTACYLPCTTVCVVEVVKCGWHLMLCNHW